MAENNDTDTGDGTDARSDADNSNDSRSDNSSGCEAASPPTSRRALLLAAGSAGAAAVLSAACAAPAGTRGTAGMPSTSASPTRPPSTTPSETARAAAAPACVLAVGAGAGPYYLDLDLVRSDITQGRDGVPLRLDLTVVRVPDGCRPLAAAGVEVWHADADGDYSTGKNTFLRGTQITDRTGHCVFHTIVPGWYAGLAPHIHFKIRPDTHTETTSQFFFPEDLLTRIYTRPPYAHRTAPEHPNQRDSRYRAAGETMTLNPTPDGNGYRATYTIGIT
ncbi:intradiol ring-cleavage dioxygenase [Streptomyces erythrochromogenes]|uniref:dioxygenase family protein n=1 Tax=Streptomyces erythrochromogenes TaxID=285574 RepID=UPI003864E4EF|nr:intradiol ring-cleavage dioxygenase [Streptomyces erythrochromogenes]WST98246.1 intradiol ring-cleavage dioxygenase [Streptomyces erythrochromogenes]